MNKILRRYKGMPQAAKASYWFVICNIFQKGLAFITIPVYTRLLTTTEYGVYSVYTTWFNIITIFASLSLSAGFFNVGILKYENEKDRFLSSVQGLGTLSTVIVLAFCFVFHGWFYKLTKLSGALLLIMSVQLLFSTPVLYWSVKQRFEYKYAKVVMVTMLSAAATVALSLFLIYFLSDRSYSLILGGALIQVVAGVFFYAHNLFKGKCFYDKYIWSHAAFFGITLIPHYLAYSVLNLSDRVMINNMCSTSDAGIYSLACQIAIAVNIVTSAVDASMNPWVYQKLKSKGYQEIARVTNYVVLVFGFVVASCALVVPEILLIIAPKAYQGAKWVMPPVIAGCFYLYLAGCFMRIAFYHEKKKIIVVASVFAAILNVILNLVFIPKFGFIAAAYTTLVSYMVFTLLHYLGMRLICKKKGYPELPFNGKTVWSIVTVTTLASLALLFLYPWPVLRYGLVFVIFISAVLNRDKLRKIYGKIKEEREK